MAEDTKPAEAAPVRKTTKEAVAPLEAEKMVKARVTKMGADKISTGKHIPGLGDELYAYAEVPTFPESVALALEQRGFAEIQ